MDAAGVRGKDPVTEPRRHATWDNGILRVRYRDDSPEGFVAMIPSEDSGKLIAKAFNGLIEEIAELEGKS